MKKVDNQEIPKHFSQSELLDGMQGLDVQTQVVVIEETLAEIGIKEFADVMALCMMTLLLDMETGSYSVELVNRVEKLKESLRLHNQKRFRT